MFPGIQGSAKFPGNPLRRISRGKGVADSIDYLAAGKEFLGHFRTQKNRDSPGKLADRKTDLALEVVCSIENNFCLVKSNFSIRRLTVRFMVSQRKKSKHNILGNMFCPESEPYHL